MKKEKNKPNSNLEEIYKNSVIRKCKVEENLDSIRLDRYLGNRFSYYSRSKWQDLIGQGLVLVNGKRIKYTSVIKKGDEIVYHLIGLKEPEIDKNIQIIYDDGDLIIVNKPANLPVIPSGKYYYNTLHTIMKETLNSNINMLNRIDRETSGCVVLSRGHELASKFCAMHSPKNSKNNSKKNYKINYKNNSKEDSKNENSKNNKIKKTYIAIVENAKNIEKNFTVEGYMEEVGNPFYRRYQILHKAIKERDIKEKSIKETNKYSENEKLKYSKTKFKTIKKFGDYAVVMARLYTGRMHQIRVHLHSLGFYMVGDKIYGKYGPEVFHSFIKKSVIPKDFFNRQALHSYKLEFNHPITDKPIKVKAPLPNDLKEFISKIKNY